MTTTIARPRRVRNQVGRRSTPDKLACCRSASTRIRNTNAQARACELLTKKSNKKPPKSSHEDSEMNSTLNRTLLPDYDGVVYTLDAKLIGNIGRYFNHSCSPNIAVQNVFVDVSSERLNRSVPSTNVRFVDARYTLSLDRLLRHENHSVGR